MTEKEIRRLALEQLSSGLHPVYCSSCGTVMSPVKLRDLPFGGVKIKYDENGNRLHVIVFKCPNSRWYHLFSHDIRYGIVGEKK